MKYKTQVRLYKAVLRVLADNSLYYIFLAILLFVIYKSLSPGQAGIEGLLDLPLMMGLLIAFVGAKVSEKIERIFRGKLEDHSKLTTDYGALIAKYARCPDMIRYKNNNKANYVKGRRYTSADRVNGESNDGDEYVFPVIGEQFLQGRAFIIKDSKAQYVLPDRLNKHYDRIMAAHRYSKTYNQLCIRLDDCLVTGDRVELMTSRTTYFDSLVTNRAMDFPWAYNTTNRELYCPGPFFPTLIESKLSNHLGFNGFVETKDGYIVFVLRSEHLSTEKGVLGNSIQASLKTKYALDDDGYFTPEGLEKGIMLEIYDELKVEASDYEFCLDENIIAFYRDLVEGGKPQLLFYVHLEIEAAKVKERFYKGLKGSSSKEQNVIDRLSVDGRKLVFINKEELDSLYIAPDIVVYGPRVYRIVPGAASALVMLIRHLHGMKLRKTPVGGKA